MAVTASDPFPASSGLALGQGLVAGGREVEWCVPIRRWWPDSMVLRVAAVPRQSATTAPISGVSGGVLRTETYEVVSWLYGEAVVEVWGRSESVCVFPATPAAAARWSVVVPVEREREIFAREKEIYGRERVEEI